jgi:hypothetical protein
VYRLQVTFSQVVGNQRIDSVVCDSEDGGFSVHCRSLLLLLLPPRLFVSFPPWFAEANRMGVTKNEIDVEYDVIARSVQRTKFQNLIVRLL